MNSPLLEILQILQIIQMHFPNSNLINQICLNPVAALSSLLSFAFMTKVHFTQKKMHKQAFLTINTNIGNANNLKHTMERERKGENDAFC